MSIYHFIPLLLAGYFLNVEAYNSLEIDIDGVWYSLSHADSGCKFYAWHTNGDDAVNLITETGIGYQKHHAQYVQADHMRWGQTETSVDYDTYFWTTCSDALWVDKFELRDEDLKTRTWGSENYSGWCVSTDNNDYKGGWESYTPAKKCFETLKLAANGYVYGWTNWHPNVVGRTAYVSFGDHRRSLQADDIEPVADAVFEVVGEVEPVPDVVFVFEPAVVDNADAAGPQRRLLQKL